METFEEAFPRPIKINLIGAVPFISQIPKDRSQVLSLSLYEINKAIEQKAIKGVDLKTAIPDEYQDFFPLFNEVIVRELPLHRPCNHTMPLKEGFTPPFGPIYSLNRVEFETLHEWIKENLAKGFIRSSSLPVGTLVLFAKKADGSLCLSVDY